MRQSFTVTVPADDLSLLTTAQLRQAAGLATGDTSRDPELTQLGLRISAEIATACQIASDGLNPPTLRSETIVETYWHGAHCDGVMLARRFVSAVSAVDECGTTIIADDYLIEREAGIIARLSSSRPWHWARGALSITYVAGFTDVPADLVGAAMDLARLRLSADAVDPMEKGRTIEIPDVETTRIDRWVGSTPGAAAGSVPADIAAKLSRYMNVLVA